MRVNTPDNNLGYTPSFYRLKNNIDKSILKKIIESNTEIRVFDEIEIQIKDLIKCQNPKINFSTELLDQYYSDFTKEIVLDEYGVWVYYPWLNNIVHILDEKEFIEVRTNRNKHKITQEEQDLLATKKIGIIGLSVGQSVALTLAMERSFGELRIADFDTLELSNLNRIRTGINNLGLAKAVIVAREIAEIDPFLKVTCYQDGINTENIDSFINEGGKLDVLIDECDNIDIKIKLRLNAKEMKVPVLMDTSDNGIVDIERFDLETDRPIFHGVLEGVCLDEIIHKNPIKLGLMIIGEKSISDRMLNSLSEIGKSITTWPQLASAVFAGGANCADLSRKICLGEKVPSGRFFLNLDTKNIDV